ncbi:hypothetical protein GGS21DRAFT_106045 [Xylaria nigripes]|nr:hypothetical protein GGS21DRAFT_106045 [Xylaria nigripes]
MVEEDLALAFFLTPLSIVHTYSFINNIVLLSARGGLTNLTIRLWLCVVVSAWLIRISVACASSGLIKILSSHHTDCIASYGIPPTQSTVRTSDKASRANASLKLLVQFQCAR